MGSDHCTYPSSKHLGFGRDTDTEGAPKRKLHQFFQEDFLDLDLEMKLSPKVEVSDLMEELSRMRRENKGLHQRLRIMSGNYNALHAQLNDLKSKNDSAKERSQSRKRKAGEDYAEFINGTNSGTENAHQSTASDKTEDSSCKKLRETPNTMGKVSTIVVPIGESDTSSVVKDGYQWRKYGQKVTRDNPSPRAYFKCSFAPSCPVKKRVQRSAEDPRVVIATYEGDHNHFQPAASNSSHRTVNLSPSMVSSAPTWALDLMQPAASMHCEAKMPVRESETPMESQRCLVAQMASSLTKNPSFTAALAAAVSGSILDWTKTEN
uniref:WRKY transcription factor 3 n=1 Tax=Santalum album TaxID=35974 RepID=A0A650C2V9_SANAL|nr:WRKY transcription factor 3 [Santalum album]